MSLNREAVGQRIREQREKLFLTREKFAEQTDISPRFLAEIESGAKGMSAETLCKICERVDVPADYLLLGRQSAGGAQTPAVEMLLSIPPQYSKMVEDILKVFLQTIEMATTHDS